jgi:NAD(P)-dependent dehydrogenase (short-subunit alcohol dehydrogenase family)
MAGQFEGFPYTTANAVIVPLTKHIAGEYGTRNIRAYTLMLGNITSEAAYGLMTEEERLKRTQQTAMNRWGNPVEGTDAACVAGDNFSFAPSNAIVIDQWRCYVLSG